MAMSKEHKDALARGRLEARAIKAYLTALASQTSGRTPTKDTLERRLTAVDAKIAASSDPLKTVEMIQNRLDVLDALKKLANSENFDELEAGFIVYAGPYSQRKEISYTAWREAGVPATTLRAAGIPETRRR